MLEVVNYIKSNGLDELVKNYSIQAKRHTKYSNLVLLKYSQVESPFDSKIVQQCRGIILDEANDWKVVCYPYNKFFNYNEGLAAKIDWENARVYEKLDGSLMTLYYYDGHWEVASSGSPDGSGNVYDHEMTFADLFWRVWKENHYSLPEHTTDVCYMFELMTPFNRIVVQHKSNRLALHGARRLSDFRELNPVVEANNNNWECVNIYSLNNMDEVLGELENLSPMQTEGYVVCDTEYNRIKVKSPKYVAIAHIHDNLSSRRMLELVRTGEGPEFLSYYPELTKDYYEVKNKYDRLLGRIEGFYEAVKGVEERKTFALTATKVPFSGLLFGKKYGKFESFQQGLSEMNIKNLEELLEKIDERK